MNVETGSPAALWCKSDVPVIGGGPAASTASVTLAGMSYDDTPRSPTG